MRCAPPPRVDPACLAVALAAAALVACGGSSGGPGAPPADAPVRIDASVDAEPQQTACQQQHLVCGRLGTESCGTCDFTATCLPEQTGCLATPPVTNASLSSIITTVEFPDRRFAFGFSGIRRAIYEINDTGTATLIDTETNQTTTPIIDALGRSDQAAFWAYEDGTIRTRPVGGATATVTRIADSCVSLAATASYLLCGLEDLTNTDQHNNGVWRYPLSNPTAGELVARA
jgi:hypothetical protein